MSEHSSRSPVFSNLRNLGWPLIIGLSGYITFLLALKKGLISNPLVIRYFAGHAVSHAATAMFLVGLAALIMKSLELLMQANALRGVRLETISGNRQRAEDAERLLARLTSLPERFQASYLWRRLHDALEFVRRKQAAEGLDAELKYLAEQDEARQYESYGLVRILIWATPMMGFLGTVIGITLALENFGKQDFADLNNAMDVLLSSLYIAFDTTALALSLSIILMFLQFVIDRFETQLLAHVDAEVARHLVGRFEETGAGADPHVRSIERMSRSVIRATEQLVERQSKLWEATIDEAHQRWTKLSDGTTGNLKSTLSESFNAALHEHAQQIGKIEFAFADQLRQRWDNWQMVLAENARVMQEQQQEMIKQGQIMNQVIASTGEVINLETVLNENLKSLSGAKNFEDTVMSLSAAIHLLNSRLGPAADQVPKVDLNGPGSQGYAA